MAYDPTPRRWRKRIEPGTRHPNGGDSEYRYGCYFPMTDLVVHDMGGRGTGVPRDVEWIDPVNDIPWMPGYSPPNPAGG